MAEQKEQKLNIFGERSKHRLPVMDLMRLAMRLFKSRPLRTFLTILGISLGIGATLFLVSLGYGLQDLLIGRLATTQDSMISIEAYYPPEIGLTLQSKDIDTIRAFPEAAEVSTVAEFPGEVSANGFSGMMMVKIAQSNYFRLAGVTPEIGESFEKDNRGVVVSSAALQLINRAASAQFIGSDIAVRAYYQAGSGPEVQVTEEVIRQVVGIIADDSQEPFIIVPAGTFATPPPYLQRLLVKATGLETVASLRDRLVEKGFLISARIDLINQARKIMNVITIVLGIFGITALIVSAIGMFNTMVIGFLERIFEVGIMKSLGATSQDIRNLFLAESFLMGFLGGVGGIVVGVLAGQIFNIGLNFLARYLGGQPVQLFAYPIRFMIFILILSAIVGILAGYWPARRAAKLSPRDAFTRS